MELKDRLKQARKNAGLTQAQLAELAGIKQSSISEIERGLSRTSGHLVKLAQICEVDPIWLAEGYAAAHERIKGGYKIQAQPNAELLGDLSVWDHEDPLDEDDCEVPYYDQVEFSGGDGMTEVIEITDRKLRFSNATLRSAGVDCKSAACARVHGRSMERLILHGAAIGFDRSDTSIIDGEIYAFNHGGMLRVKYLYRLPAGAIRIRSENTEDYPDEIMGSEEFREEVKMLGRVFWWSTVRRSPRKI
ncbi:XRE family transcriptional regulator [Pseudomonas sp. GL-B-19]|uniref:XRE family transcriptional regulator n=1 Tax=Pseudomonas sp. GL-B-19 TaxID=2832393 RepID=UPI001CBCACD4|nr:helix-turn-helix transcriptional regulator [Pseudomonas sp. GL-B-19]